jgi:hypothetical protein
MTLEVDCDACGYPLRVPGALMFSPPGYLGQVIKYHLCNACWPRAAHLVTQSVEPPAHRHRFTADPKAKSAVEKRIRSCKCGAWKVLEKPAKKARGEQP